MADWLIRRNLLPDPILRWGIRRLLRSRLKEEGRWDGVEKQQERVSRLVQSLRQSPIAVQTPAANEQHYEVPTRFYQSVLGKHLKYSCGYWPAGVTTLDESEEAMLELTCQRARVEDGLKLLDLGCGWGALSLYLARRYPRCQVTGVSNSATQRAHILDQARKRGLKNLRIVTGDINHLSLKGKFDRILSVEMFEHMRNYERLMAKVASWLRPQGLLFVHIFTHKDLAYLFEDKGREDWMSRYFFTGGIMPSDHLLFYFQEKLGVVDHWRVSGTHYQKTSEAWLANMDRNREAILAAFAETYGPPNALWRWSYWRVFFMACSELWGYGGGNEWLVSHYLFQKK
ncbi:MAG TPA: cyclopropane-fatty-acyl-phospholipid synthase family protein [bacterium]|nr:cyclopropane-fatty-acyl-phospholipid synthase family protein [bacterium]